MMTLPKDTARVLRELLNRYRFIELTGIATDGTGLRSLGMLHVDRNTDRIVWQAPNPGTAAKLVHIQLAPTPED